MNASRSSSREIVRTRTPLFGTNETSPSAASRRSASRIGVRETSNCSESCSWRRTVPGSSSPATIASSITSAMSSAFVVSRLMLGEATPAPPLLSSRRASTQNPLSRQAGTCTPCSSPSSLRLKTRSSAGQAGTSAPCSSPSSLRLKIRSGAGQAGTSAPCSSPSSLRLKPPGAGQAGTSAPCSSPSSLRLETRSGAGQAGTSAPCSSPSAFDSASRRLSLAPPLPPLSVELRSWEHRRRAGSGSPRAPRRAPRRRTAPSPRRRPRRARSRHARAARRSGRACTHCQIWEREISAVAASSIRLSIAAAPTPCSQESR